MVRLFSFLAALMIALPVLWLGLYGTARLSHIAIHPAIQSYAQLSRPGAAMIAIFVCMFGAGIAIAVGIHSDTKARHVKRDEDGPLTPMVRRLPSGLREL